MKQRAVLGAFACATFYSKWTYGIHLLKVDGRHSQRWRFSFRGYGKTNGSGDRHRSFPGGISNKTTSAIVWISQPIYCLSFRVKCSKLLSNSGLRVFIVFSQISMLDNIFILHHKFIWTLKKLRYLKMSYFSRRLVV